MWIWFLLIQHEVYIKNQRDNGFAFEKSKGILAISYYLSMKIPEDTAAFVEQMYPLILDWVLHNEAHRKTMQKIGKNCENPTMIQIPFIEFAEQYNSLQNDQP